MKNPLTNALKMFYATEINRVETNKQSSNINLGPGKVMFDLFAIRIQVHNMECARSQFAILVRFFCYSDNGLPLWFGIQLLHRCKMPGRCIRTTPCTDTKLPMDAHILHVYVSYHTARAVTSQNETACLATGVGQMIREGDRRVVGEIGRKSERERERGRGK